MEDDDDKIVKVEQIVEDVKGEKYDPVCKKGKCPFMTDKYKPVRGINICNVCGCLGVIDGKGDRHFGPIHASRVLGIGAAKDYKWLLIEYKSEAGENWTTILPQLFDFAFYINTVAWYYVVTKQQVPALRESTVKAFEHVRRFPFKLLP